LATYKFTFAVVLHGAYFAYSGHCTRIGLSIPYVLTIIGDDSSTR